MSHVAGDAALNLLVAGGGGGGGGAGGGAPPPPPGRVAPQFLTAKTQTTPPCGTSVFVPRKVSRRACIR
jgi:hypothetical protein